MSFDPLQELFQPNLTLDFNQNLTPIKIYDNISVSERIHNMRKAAEVHKIVRNKINNIMKPGMKIFDICNYIENTVCDTFQNNNLKCGIGFPVGFSLNNIIAHDTACINDNRVLGYNDIVKIDFGTHVNGNIIDSAYTFTFNPDYEPLINATKDATWNAIKMCGPDAYINDISKIIDETIESYEIELNNNIYPIKTVGELGGHNIRPYIIHAGQVILCKPDLHSSVHSMRMKSNECYAIETFASTGTGKFLHDDSNNNLYSLNTNANTSNIGLDITKKVLSYIKTHRNSLPFCSRWIFDKFGQKGLFALKDLSNKKILNNYPPLYDIEGSYSSQLEHTIFIHDYGKEILSKGPDY